MKIITVQFMCGVNILSECCSYAILCLHGDIGGSRWVSRPIENARLENLIGFFQLTSYCTKLHRDMYYKYIVNSYFLLISAKRSK